MTWIKNIHNIYNHKYINSVGIKIIEKDSIYSSYVTHVKYISKGKNSFIFRVISDNIKLCFKIVTYDSVNANLYESKISEHINTVPTENLRKYYMSTNITRGLPKLNNDNQYLNDILRNFNKIKLYSNVTIYEWIEGIDFLNYLNINRLNINIIKEIITVLLTLSKYIPGFRHNDLHFLNIIMRDNKPIIIDFDYSTIFNLLNPKITPDITNRYGIRNDGNIFYDIHYFLNQLLHKKLSLTSDIIKFIHNIIPKELRGMNKKKILSDYRLLQNYNAKLILDKLSISDL